VPFPFTDLTGTKQRPALVISPDIFNSTRDDVLIAAITSQVPVNLKADEFLIPSVEMAVAGLPKPSIVKVLKLVSIHQGLIVRQIGRLPEPTVAKILNQIRNLL